MSWADHVDAISMKINQRIGLIRRIRNLLPLQARVALYNALILPLFDYGDVIWGDRNNDTIMSELQILQNKAGKVRPGQPPRSSSTEATEESKLKSPQEGFFIASLQSTSVLLEKPISTLILLKLKLFIHIIQVSLMILAYPYPEQTGVNKLLFFTPQKTGTAFQMI